MILEVIQTGLAILVALGLFGTAFSILLDMEQQKDTDRKGKTEENDSSRSI